MYNKFNHSQKGQLTPEVRLRIAEFALTHSIQETARKFDVMRVTVRCWKNRLINNESFENMYSKSLNYDELNKIIKNSSLPGEPSAIYLWRKLESDMPYTTFVRRLRNLNVPAGYPKLVKYRCNICPKTIKAITIYYGIPKKPTCPLCIDGRLTRLEVLRIPFFNPSAKDFFISSGELILLQPGLFTDEVKSHLVIPKTLNAQFVKHDRMSNKDHIHVIKEFHQKGVHWIPICYCGTKFNDVKNRQILFATDLELKIDNICRHCQYHLSKVFHASGDLKPALIYEKISKLQRTIRLFQLKRETNSIISACRIMGITPTSFYRAKSKYWDFYREICT